MLNILRSAGAKLAGGRAASSGLAREIGSRAVNRGTNILRGGLREVFNPTGTWTSTSSVTGHTLSGMVHGGMGNMVPVLGRQVTREITRTRGMTGIVGAGLKHVGPRLGAAAAIDWYQDTPAGQEMGGLGRLGLSALSVGLKVGAARHAARGITGTGLSMLGRATGNASRFQGAYSWMHTKTGNMFQSGSVTNFALKQGFAGAKGVIKTPFRMITGAPHALGASVKGASRLFGSAGEAWGGGLKALAGNRPGLFNSALRGLGGAASGAGRVGGRWGQENFGRIMTPQFTRSKGFNDKVHKWTGLINKEGHAPIMSGFMAMGMIGSAAHSYASSSTTPYNMRGLDPLSKSGIRPSYYGAGVHAMRRGASRNYGPALTLQLHRGHSRVMPH